MNHDWTESTLGHGNKMCRRCKITDLEAGALDIMNECDGGDEPDKFVSPHAPPEGLTRELLEILAEECAEAIQRIQKAQRFGLREQQPGQGYMNVQRIAHEIGDVIETLHWCFEHEILSQKDVNHGRQRKAAQLSKYVQNRTHEPDPDDDLGAYQI